MEVDQLPINATEEKQPEAVHDNSSSNPIAIPKIRSPPEETPQEQLKVQKSPEAEPKVLTNSRDSEAKTQSKQRGDKAPASKKKPPKPKDVLPPNYKLIQTYKITNDSEKERKQYEDKVIAMKNRLKALKKQEQDLQRKMHLMSNKEKDLDVIKSEKVTFKHALSSHKSERNKKLEDQRRKNGEEKLRVSSAVKNAINESKSKKHSDFDLARTEKQIIVSLISENNDQLDNLNQKRINQIKSEHETFKAEEQRKQKEKEDQLVKYYLEKREKENKTTSRLKSQIAHLEKLEEQYLESLQNTRMAGMQHSSMQKTNTTKVLKVTTETLSIRKLELEQRDKRAMRSKSTTTNSKDANLNRKYNSHKLVETAMVKSSGNISQQKKSESKDA